MSINLTGLKPGALITLRCGAKLVVKDYNTKGPEHYPFIIYIDKTRGYHLVCNRSGKSVYGLGGDLECPLDIISYKNQ